MLLAQAIDSAANSTSPWRYQFHPEVWILVGSLTALYIYMVKVVGPRAVPEGTSPVSRKNIYAFVGAMVMLWVASDWPLHDISEEYLYSAHMFQHMMLTYFLPPLALLATPEWLLRVLIGNGKLYSALSFMCRPVVAGVAFNVAVIVTHIPIAVNESVANGPLHYSLHFVVVMLSLLMWMPVCGPFPEYHLTPIGKSIYLFLQSIVPTLPAAWLTFAEGTVYEAYDIPTRLLGLSITEDQQLAGAVMKLGGSIFLWTLIVFIYFKRFASTYRNEHNYKRRGAMPTAEITGHDEFPLTTEDVEREFARTHAGPDGDPPADGASNDAVTR
ncbi:MAG: cytochrome c oxidase assembly protein [Actinomycetota bacterium]